MDTKNSIMAFLLTSAVLSSIITSSVNIIISIINNKKVKTLEKLKMENGVVLYRYTHLYEIWCEMHKNDNSIDYDMDIKRAAQIELNEIYSALGENVDRVAVMKPLLNNCYIEQIEKAEKDAIKAFKAFANCEGSQEEQDEAEHIYFDTLSTYISETEKALQNQLAELLQ